jgi:hypothetical protein
MDPPGGQKDGVLERQNYSLFIITAKLAALLRYRFLNKY